MEIHYSAKPFDNLSKKTIDQLLELSFKNGYGIESDIDLYYDYKKKKNIEKTKTWTAIIARHNGTPIGWAMIRNLKATSYMMFYINPIYRRLGIGAKLFELSTNYLIKKGKNTSIVFPHDYKSGRFFTQTTSEFIAKEYDCNRLRIYLNKKKNKVNIAA